jgi:hypothetical protein
MEKEKSKESRVVRVKLYASALEGTEGKLYARLAHERTLSVGDVCDIAKGRGGLPWDPRVLENRVHRFLEEMFRQVCNGLTVNLAGFLSISAHVAGLFERLRKGITPGKHRVEIRYRNGIRSHEAAELVEVYVEGMAEPRGCLDEFTDVKTGLVNQKVTPGGQFVSTGELLKIFGPNPENGLYFTLPGNPVAEVKMMDGLAVNEPQRLAGVIPNFPLGRLWTLEIRTQFANSSTPMKEQRIIRSDFSVSS